jgi:DNA polymerase V
MILQSQFALVDCNNFFASCERVFQPQLEKRPVLVLSNNDGCVIARSNETKALGIKMGVPYFQIQNLVEKHKITVFSSNFALYGDMSQRVMNILLKTSANVEIYSIDEAFLDFTDIKKTQDRLCYAKLIRENIKQSLGLPVSIGIGPSKTLAKLANHIAKKYKPISGVIELSDEVSEKHWLDKIPIQEIWGIGKKTADQLEKFGYHTALQLQKANPDTIKQQFNISVMRTVLELKGQSCIELDTENNTRKRIRVSRSFGHKVKELHELNAALSTFVAKASQKLRRQHSVAGALLVFLKTNFFDEREPKYLNSITIPLAMPTSDTRILIEAALKGLKNIYHPDYYYKKVGVILLELNPKNKLQLDMFSEINTEKSDQLMRTLDSINQQMGQGILYYAIQDAFSNKEPLKSWKSRGSYRSPCYTTCWQDLLKVYAK